MSDNRKCPKCGLRNGMMLSKTFIDNKKAESSAYCMSCDTCWLFRYKEVGYQEIKGEN